MLTKKKQLTKNKDQPKPTKRYRKCKYCGEKSVPYGAMQPFCFKNKCIKAHNQKTIKAQIKQLNEKDTRYWIRIATKWFNQYIRHRDKDLNCISCDYDFKKGSRQGHAGHFRPAGNHSILRFNELNVWKQCSICNNHKSGNVGAYERALRGRIGDDEVDTLLNNNTPKKWTIEELQSIVEESKLKLEENFTQKQK
ncbi:MAG TPA: recombination protein NinG [Sulfurimonas sp.]|nr:recombination protein NinG [Sulfurimonas sp.]